MMQSIFPAVALLLAAQAAHADTIDRIRESGTIRLAHRTDAAPFASLDAAGQAVGYSVELCRRVADAIKASMPERTLTMQFVPVTALDRFEAITQGRADLLCEATTVTLGRREQLDFSLYTYVTGAGVIVRRGAPTTATLQGARTVGVLRGTTTETAMRRLAANPGARLTLLPVETHDVAIGALRSRQIDAYVADRDLLTQMLAARGNPADILIADDFLTLETYALAMRRGEDRLRLIADRTLAGLYRSGEILEVLRRAMPTPEPSTTVRLLYGLQALAE